MAMRSRYSRRIYSMKFGSNRSSDYIDDEDMKFLENLISFHKSYLENFKKKINLDASLLPSKLGDIYNKISKNFSITKTSEGNEELYHNLDLRYQGEEYHFRNIKEQIINYLNNKKHQIFTNHRVDFLINIVLNTVQGNLRDVCKEMVYKPNKVDAIDDVDFETNEYINNEEDGKTINDMILTNLAKMDTLLLPYISMFHPKPKMEYDEASKFILEMIRHDTEDKTISKRIINEKLELDVDKSNKKKIPILSNNNIDIKSPLQIQNPNPEMEQVSTKSCNNHRLDNFDEQSDSNSPKIMPNLLFHSTLLSTNEDSNPLHHRLNPPPLMSSSASQFPAFISPIVSSSSPLLSTNHSVDSPHETNISPEVIEISDEENDEDEIRNANVDDKRSPSGHRQENAQLSYSDIDQMIDFLMHRCKINPDLHPSLLRDYQMNVELNGFLLFVNFSIRFSLKYPLGHADRRIFECIFISSVTVGLVSCAVSFDPAGLRIDKLTNTGFYIVNSRLRSVQVSIKHVERKSGDLFSVVIDPDIGRLVRLTLVYIEGYRDTGVLVERTAPPNE